MGKTSPLQRSNQAPCTGQYTQRRCFYLSSSHWGILPENRLFWAFLASQLVLPACNRGAVWVYPIFPRHILQTTFQFDKFVRKLSTIVKAPGGSVDNGGWGFPWICCSWDNRSCWCWRLFYSCCCRQNLPFSINKAHLCRGPSSTASPSSTSKTT